MDSIIFDVDGTLWDSTEIVAESWDEYLHNKEHMNITITAERLMGLFGQPLPAIAAQLLPDKTEAEQLRIIDACCQAEHEALLKTCAPLYEDLEKTLKTLSEKYPLYIVSNCQDGYIQTFLEVTGLGNLFEDFTCSGMTGLGKGDNIRLIVQKHHLDRAVYLGDTQGDYNACQKAQVPFIQAAYGMGSVDAKVPSISCFAELPDAVAEIMK